MAEKEKPRGGKETEDESTTSSTDQNRLVLCTAVIVLVVFIPIAWGQFQTVLEQRRVVTEWRRVGCHMHFLESYDASVEKRILVKSGDEKKLRAKYSYVVDGANRTSTRVYFMGKKHAGRPRRTAERVLAYFNSTCVAWYDPQDPAQSVLIPEVSFHPYSNLLFIAAAVLATIWYVVIEYDWNSSDGVLSKFTEDALWKEEGLVQVGSLDDTQWYRVPIPRWIKSWKEMFLAAAAAAGWHVAGWALRNHFEVHHHTNEAAPFLIFYHGAGMLLAARCAFLILITMRVQEVELFVSCERIAMGSPFSCLFKQKRRSGWLFVRYHEVEVAFSLTETVQGPRQNRGPNRTVKCLHREARKVLHNYALPPGATGVLAALPFGSHVCHLKPSDGKTTTYYRWCLDLTVRISLVPSTYNISVPFEAYVPEELRPKDF